MTETTLAAPAAPLGLLAFLRERRGPGRAAQGPPGARKGLRARRRLVVLLMLLVVPLVGIFGAVSSASAADDNEDLMKFSFYNASSSTTAFFSTIQNPEESGTFQGPWLAVMKKPGSAGSLLGYADPNFSDVTGWLTSKLSGSSDAIGYESLRVRDGSEDAASSTFSSEHQGLTDYAYFGAALKGMGLDDTSTGLSLSFMNKISGGLVMTLYIFSSLVDMLFTAFIKFLAVLNPFKLFFLGVQTINPDLADSMTGGSGGVGAGPLQGIASWIGGWYQTLHALSWAVIVPIFIGVLLFSLVMFKQMNRGGAIKKLFIRLLFIVFGLPLLGSMYTGVLDSMTEASIDGNAGSTRVVMSTYVDFENWVLNSRLALPDSALVAWDPSGAQPTGKAQAQVRNTALAINNQTHGLGLTAITSAGNYDGSFSDQIMSEASSGGATKESNMSTTVDMLIRYMGNDQISAASLETTMQGNLVKEGYYESNKEQVSNWFKDLDQSAEDMNDLGDESSPSVNPLVSVADGKGLQGKDVVGGDGGRVFSSEVQGCLRTGTKIISLTPAPRACNLSPMSMYNYLNTDFGPTSMTMYSSSNVMSEATRSIHNSVNQVGTGTMGFLYWFNAVILLGSFVTIGVGYAFSMLFASIRRSFQIVTAVPFATLGALAAIAKLIVYTIALILEVILTIFVYKMVQEFLISLPQIIEMPFAAILNNGSTGVVAFLVSGWAFSMVITVISIIAVTVFTIMALRLRKTFVKAVEEVVTKLVEKFMDTSAVGGGGKMMPALAGGLAAGAGSAAANRMMGGGSKGPKAAALPGGGGEGPAGIETAGGAMSTDSGPDDGSGAGGMLEIEGGGQLAIAGAADGNGDPGTPLAAGEAGSTGGSTAQEVALGRDVEANGLSKPGSDEAAAPQVGGDDAMSAASNSVDESAAGYQAADAKRLDGAKDGAEAVGHGAIAVGRGMAGDGAGAAESAGKAVEKGGSAAAANEQAKQMESDAGRSSLDKPDNRHAQRAQQAQQVSAAGGAVAGAAGAAGGASGGGKAASTSGKAPGPSTAPKPVSGTSGPAPARQAPAAPAQRQGGQQAPQRTPQAPAQRQAPKPAQQPQQAPAPRQAPAQAPQRQRQTPAPAAPRRAPVAPRPPSRGSSGGAGGTSGSGGNGS